MILRKWEDLPSSMQKPEVREYYDILKKKKGQLILKRVFDAVVSFLLLKNIVVFPYLGLLH